MIESDPLFKRLLTEFLMEFITLFYPDIAEKLDFTYQKPLDKEMFTDFEGGQVRIPDFLMETRTRDGKPEILLVHIEVQSRREHNVPERMFGYYTSLRSKYRIPVLPLVVYLARGANGVSWETYQETLLGKEHLHFGYYVIGLRDLPADTYLAM